MTDEKLVKFVEEYLANTDKNVVCVATRPGGPAGITLDIELEYEYYAERGTFKFSEMQELIYALNRNFDYGFKEFELYDEYHDEGGGGCPTCGYGGAPEVNRKTYRVW